MVAGVTHWSFRQATVEDRERLCGIHSEAMRPYIERIWGWYEDFQQAYNCQAVVDSAHQVIAPAQTRHGRAVAPAPRGRIPKHLSAKDRMRRKLRTKRGRQRYALRMEPVFGQIKQGRGFRQFLLLSLEKANREWLLICAGHNLLKLFRFGSRLPGKVLGGGPTRNINESSGTASASILGRLSGHSRLTPAGIAVAN